MARFLMFMSLGLLAVSGSASAQEEPDDEREYELAMASRTLQESCLICHTPAMIEQQRLSPATWAAEVDKMIGWGAPVKPEEKDWLIDLLATKYPTDKPRVEPARMTAAEVRALDRLADPEPLAAKPEEGHQAYRTNCASCHGEDATGGDLGNNLFLNPVLMDRARYAKIVGQGQGKMPAFAAVLKPEEVEAVLAWLRTRPMPSP